MPSKLLAYALAILAAFAIADFTRAATAHFATVITASAADEAARTPSQIGLASVEAAHTN
ncbi:MAG: hypothetical protein AB7E80_05155 [Hyphomicrobiaceae bacterium]